MGAAQRHRGARDAGDRFADEVLGPVERRQRRRGGPLGVAEPGRVMRQQPGGVQVDAHLGHLASDVGMIGERLGEARRRSTLDGLDDGPIRRDGDAEIDGRVGGPEPPGPLAAKRQDVLRPEQERVVGYPALLEHHGIAAGGAHPERVPHLLDPPSGRLGRHQEQHGGGR